MLQPRFQVGLCRINSKDCWLVVDRQGWYDNLECRSETEAHQQANTFNTYHKDLIHDSVPS